MYINKHVIHIYIYPRPMFYKEEDPEALTWDEQLTSRWQGEIPKLNRPFLKGGMVTIPRKSWVVNMTCFNCPHYVKT